LPLRLHGARPHARTGPSRRRTPARRSAAAHAQLQRPAREERGARGSVAQHGRLDPVLEQLRAQCSRSECINDGAEALSPATSAPGLSPPRPHLHRDRAHPPTSAPGLGSPSPTSAPGLGSPLAHLCWDLANAVHICAGTGPTWPPAYETMMPAMRATHEHEPIACRTPHALQRARACCNGKTQCAPFLGRGSGGRQRRGAGRLRYAKACRAAAAIFRTLSASGKNEQERTGAGQDAARARGESLYNASGSFGADFGSHTAACMHGWFFVCGGGHERGAAPWCAAPSGRPRA
jgi:hypothetical protein